VADGKPFREKAIDLWLEVDCEPFVRIERQLNLVSL